jgi:hypothetical protein
MEGGRVDKVAEAPAVGEAHGRVEHREGRHPLRPQGRR